MELRGQKSLERVLYLKNMLRPILDTYIVCLNVLKRLVAHEAQEKELQMEMLSEIKGQLQHNKITYGEQKAFFT